jgi:hypothetical protein
MKFDRSMVTRIVLTSILAVVSFVVGFFVAGKRGDGTPGGFGHGLVIIEGASPVSNGLGGWPCGPSNKDCSFAFHFQGSDETQPTAVACEHQQACLTFSGHVTDEKPDFSYEMHNGTYVYPETPVFISGALEFYKK